MAAPAHAWNTCGAFAAAAGTAADNIGSLGSPIMTKPNTYHYLCHDTSGVVDSTLLRVEAEWVSVELDPNMGSIDGGPADCEIYVYRCRSSTATTADLTSCTKEIVDTDADGIANDVTLDGVTNMRRGIQSIQAKFLLIVVSGNDAPAENCRTMVSGY